MGFETLAERAARLQLLKTRVEEYAVNKIELIDAEALYLRAVLASWGISEEVAEFHSYWERASMDEFLKVG
jgi:hypothetical protein